MWERIASVAKKKGGMNSQLKWYINNIEHARNLENFDFISILFRFYFKAFHLPLPKPISSTEHIPVSFSVSSSSFKLFVGFCLKYIFWFPGQIFAASLRITAILLKCKPNSNNFPFLIILQPFYIGFSSSCRRLEYEHNFPNIANTVYYTYLTRYKFLLLSLHVLWSSFLIFLFHLLLSLTTCNCWFCFLSNSIWG